MRPLPCLALAFAVLAAGCSSAPAAPAAPSPSTTSTPSAPGAAPAAGAAGPAIAAVAPPVLEFSGCRQLHTFFPFPLAALQALGFQLPEGFALAPSDPAGGVANVAIAWWFCTDGRLNHTVAPAFGPSGSMLVGIQVIPPASYANASVDLDLVAATWVLSAAPAARHLQGMAGIGDLVEAADVSRYVSMDASSAVVIVDSAQASPSFGLFFVDTAVQAAPAPNPESVYRLWQAPNGTATGFLEIRNLPGATVGAGAASLRFVGDPTTGAPPLLPGQAHVVDGVGVRLAPRPLPQA